MKVRRFSGSIANWEDAANKLARDYTPTIYACQKCLHPVINGFGCDYCGNLEPYIDNNGERQGMRDYAGEQIDS